MELLESERKMEAFTFGKLSEVDFILCYTTVWSAFY